MRCSYKGTVSTVRSNGKSEYYKKNLCPPNNNRTCFVFADSLRQASRICNLATKFVVVKSTRCRAYRARNWCLGLDGRVQEVVLHNRDVEGSVPGLRRVFTHSIGYPEISGDLEFAAVRCFHYLFCLFVALLVHHEIFTKNN